jgi:hypothetical protein
MVLYFSQYAYKQSCQNLHTHGNALYKYVSATEYHCDNK